MESQDATYTYIFNLADHVSKLLEQAPHATEHVQGRAIFTDDRVKVLAFPFEAGQALTEHTAPHPIVLHFLDGEANVTLGTDAVDARAGTWIQLLPHVPHSIHARTACMMLLSVFHS